MPNACYSDKPKTHKKIFKNKIHKKMCKNIRKLLFYYKVQGKELAVCLKLLLPMLQDKNTSARQFLPSQNKLLYQW
jgi:hypothetical protein